MGETPNEAPVVSIVIVTYNALHHVRECLEGIRARTHLPLEVVVVDNASEANTRDYLRACAGLRLILNDENRLWAAGCNQGMRAADPRSRYLLLLNSDVAILRDDWLEVMIALMESTPRVAVVGPVHRHSPVGPLFGFIDGQCMLIRRDAVAAFARGWIYKAVHPADRIIHHHRGGSKTPSLEAALDRMPRAACDLEAIIRRHGLRPTRSPLDHKFVPSFLRRFRRRRRFYYADPVTDDGGSLSR
jgi:glycosyltransferase involved in cell wall biosynthesis